jgi:hypothetical protein
MMTSLNLIKAVLGAAVAVALLGGCNKRPADQPVTPETTTPATTPAPAATPPDAATPPATPATPPAQNGTTPPASNPPPTTNQ